MTKRRLILWISVICLLVVLMSGTALAATTGWNKNADGTYSYYDYGYWYSNGEYYIDGEYYRFDSNGIMLSDSWYEEYGIWYYYGSNGARKSDVVCKIGGYYYGFDYDGWMYTDTTFYSGGECYRAKADGTLYNSGWYETDWDSWYYYNSDATAAQGFEKIGNTWYFFYDDGQLVEEGVVEENGVYYIIYNEGASYKALTTAGWYNAGGDYYYYKGNGDFYHNEVKKIGGVYYGFDWNGRMFDDAEFCLGIYDDNGDWVGDNWYRAKAGGALYTNEWYQTNWGGWYYYNSDGTAACGFKQIGSTWYFFYDGGGLCEEGIVEENGVYYIIYNEGASYKALTKAGWYDIAGDYYYYGGNGNVYTNGVYKIGNAYYGFDWDGRMYDNTEFEMDTYDEDGDWLGWKQYRAKAGGALYVNQWYQDGTEWYYYGAEGQAPRGYTKLGSAAYYFYYAGRMATSTYEYVDGVYYAFGEDGTQITKQGKQDAGSYYVYVNADGTIVYDDWVKIGANWHYFWPEMVANTVTELDGALYAVNNAGVCVAVTGNGVYDVGYHGKVYIENGKVVENTWKQIGGAWYYFDYGMCKNGVYEIDGTQYVFDQNGRMFTGGWLLLGESYSKGYYEDGSRCYVYADASGKAATGMKTIGGQQYIFSEWGYLYTDTSVTINGVTYVVGESGAVISTINNNGWKQLDGKWYYVQNGRILKEEILTLGGKKYVFDYNGVMVTNQTYWVDGIGRALVKEDGTLLVDGWAKLNGHWYYADADGVLADYGKYTIGGQNYIFEDCAMRTGTFMWDGMIITTNASGTIVSEKDPAAGWTYVDGRVLYYKNGEPYSGWVGDYLIRYGEMSINDYWSWEGDWYAFDTYGKYVKSGWHQFNYGFGKSDYVYAKAGGKLCCDEWLQIGSKWYYFEGVWMLSDGTYYVDGQLCRFDANGVYLGNGTTVSGNDGWKQTGSSWYYIHAGEPVVGMRWIEGKRYVFDWDGVMQSSGYTNIDGIWYYTDASGAIPNYTGWKMISGEWCYFDNSNMPVLGWFQDGGKEYHAEVKLKKGVEVIGLTTGYLYNNGQLYYFNSSGVCQGTRGVNNGWYQAGGDWYYFINGTAVSYEEQYIGGKLYYFANGVMLSDVIVDGYYFGNDGTARTTTGWYKTSEGWVYVMDSTGKLANGVQKIGGKEYYFNNCVMVR